MIHYREGDDPGALARLGLRVTVASPIDVIRSVNMDSHLRGCCSRSCHFEQREWFRVSVAE